MEEYYDFDRENDKDFLREAGKMLQEEVVTLRIEVIQLKLQNAKDKEIKIKLTGELLVLRRRIFDSKQEKKEKLKEFKKKKKKKNINIVHNQNENKNIIDAHNASHIELESEEIEHDLDSDQCPCCSGENLKELHKLFEESTEFDVNHTYYILKRHKRKKYKCQNCQKIVTAPGPTKLTPGGKFSIQMAIQIACDKFEHHLPLERQRKKMKNAGLLVSVKTLFSLTEHLYNILYPLYKMNQKDIIEAKYVCIDESPVPFYNDEKSSGFAWSLSNQRGAYYQYEPSRSAAVAKEILEEFEGIVVTDGYSGYCFLGDLENIIHAACWSHMRRYFFDAFKDDPDVEVVIDLIDELYDIEHQAQSYSDLKYLRRTRSHKIYKDIEKWVSENEGSYLSATLTGKAINYFYKHKEGLTHFLENEHVPLDNNMAERRQRCPVMGRKNYQAFRSINGADVGMFFYSIIESCKTNGLNASSYLLEMALKKLNSEEIETPYKYACRLRSQIEAKLKNELQGIPPS